MAAKDMIIISNILMLITPVFLDFFEHPLRLYSKRIYKTCPFIVCIRFNKRSLDQTHSIMTLLLYIKKEADSTENRLFAIIVKVWYNLNVALHSFLPRKEVNLAWSISFLLLFPSEQVQSHTISASGLTGRKTKSKA